MKIGTRVEVRTLSDDVAYAGAIVKDDGSRKVTVRDDELGEDHEVIRSLVVVK